MVSTCEGGTIAEKCMHVDDSYYSLFVIRRYVHCFPGIIV